MVIVYLVAIVLANLSVAQFGPSVSILNAFLFIGLDLTSRDILHERWQGKHLTRNMALLIITGSVLSFVLNHDAGRIALASCVAFGASASVDAVAYHVMRRRSRVVRINGSNVMSAGADSVMFPALAFGFPLLLDVMLGQFLAKVGGGFIWSVVLDRIGKWRNRHAA